MTSHERFDEVVAAYALDALDPVERPAFEAHLATCAVCQAELRDLRRVAAAIGAGAPAIAPPADLKARVMAHATAGSSMGSAARPVRRRSGPSGAPWLAVAAAALIAMAAGAFSWHEWSAAAAARVRTAALERQIAVITAPDVVVVKLAGQPAAPAAAGRAYLSASRGLAVSVERLPALPQARGYQLWIVPASGAPVSLGMLAVDANGATHSIVPVPASAGAPAAVAVTIEPAGGVVAPTGPKVLVGVVGQ